jgi:hypothetical protein
MSGNGLYSKKGYRALQAKDAKGNTGHVAAPIGGKLDSIYNHNVKKQNRERKQAFREFKAAMRIAKKAIPAEQRAHVNWSQVTNG